MFSSVFSSKDASPPSPPTEERSASPPPTYSAEESERLRLELEAAQREGQRLQRAAEADVEAREPSPRRERDPIMSALVTNVEVPEDVTAPSYEELMDTVRASVGEKRVCLLISSLNFCLVSVKCRPFQGRIFLSAQVRVVSPETRGADSLSDSFSEDDAEASLAADAAKVAMETMRSHARAYAESKTDVEVSIDDIVQQHTQQDRVADADDADEERREESTKPHAKAAQQAKELMAKMRREAEEYAQAKARDRETRALVHKYSDSRT
mmetsp:Transcript_14891/g.48577  ORF Transcript_14891/g.48577 Transcript_14891/m.48577 type:complete len:268 (+) Transcript_14891:107-910(+)